MISLNLVINNRTELKIISKKEIEEEILKILKQKKVNLPVEIGLNLVSREEVQKLNQKYRGKNYPSEVLSFPLWDRLPKKSTKTLLLGDMVISAEVTSKARFKNLVQHATYYLLGKHHK